METNIHRTFLNLVKKHFPPNNSFQKISTRTPSKLLIVAWKILVWLLRHIINEFYIPKLENIVVNVETKIHIPYRINDYR